MPDPQTTNKQLFTPAHGSDVDSWDVPVNFNWTQLDAALGTYTTLNANGLSGTVALTTSMTAPLGFIVTGTPAGSLTYTTPAGVGGFWVVRNRATLGASITLGFASASGGSTVNVPASTNVAISADGTVNGMGFIDTRAPTPGGSNTQVQVNVNGALGGYAGFTFDGTILTVPTIDVTDIAISGTGTAVTQASLDDSTKLATTQYADNNLIQIVTTGVTAASDYTGTYSTQSGAAPTTAGGTKISVFDTTFTPKNSGSILEISVSLKGTPQGTDCFMVALFDGTSLIDAAQFFIFNGPGQNALLSFTTEYPSPGTSARSLTVRIGANSSTPFSLNKVNTGSGYGAQSGLTSSFTIKEILPHP